GRGRDARERTALRACSLVVVDVGVVGLVYRKLGDRRLFRRDLRVAGVRGLYEQLSLLDEARRHGHASRRRRVRVPVEEVLAELPAGEAVEKALVVEEACLPLANDLVRVFGDVDVLAADERACRGKHAAVRVCLRGV